MKVAVVTPYFREPLEVLRRCHDSVRAQTHACTHILVSDGHPRPELEAWDAWRLALPFAHADAGDTARGLGGLSAFNQGFDAVAYLDADNWYAPDHVAAAVDAAGQGADAVFASRRIVLSTGQPYPDEDPDILARRTVDTSCVFLTAAAIRIAAVWCLMPPWIAPLGDRLILRAVRHHGVAHAWTGRQTVVYESRWPRHFAALGLPPPPDAHAMDLSGVQQRYDAAEMVARLGFDPFPQAPLPAPA